MFIPTAVSRILHRADDLARRRGVWSKYRLLQESESWNRTRLRAFQLEKLKRLLVHAGARSPYYTELFRSSGLRVDSLESLEQLRDIPLLTREVVHDSGERIRSTGIPPGRMQPNNTSGSSGTITHFWVDSECWSWRNAVSYQMWERLGARAGEPMVNVWGSPVDERWIDGTKNRVRRFFDNKRIVSAYRLGPKDVVDLVAYLNRFQPRILTGYASALDLIATQVLSQGLPWRRTSPLLVVSQAEVLYPEQRTTIERALQARVLDVYGSRELGVVALECPSGGGMHIVEERHLVEFVPSNGGGPDRLVVTDLDNYAFPFIRYEIGDLATAESTPCPCGRSHSRVGFVQGRSFAVVRSPEGKAVAGNFFSFLLRESVRGVHSWQVVQRLQDLVELRVTPPGALSDGDRSRIIQEVKRALGGTMRVEIVEKDWLEPLPSGKHSFVTVLPEAR